MHNEKPVLMLPARHLLSIVLAGIIAWIVFLRFGHWALRWLVSL